MSDFDDIKKVAKLPTRTVSLCLDGELVDQLEQLERQLADAKPATNIGDVSPRRAKAEQIVALQEQMRESTRDFHLRALGARAWSRFWASTPTREEKETDEAWDEKIYPFYAEMLSRSCVKPAMSVEQVDELVEVIHNSAWSQLINACLVLNRAGIDIPNSAAASELIGTSEQT